MNRELITFPSGVHSRTEAIQFRIDNAGLHRKIGKNQTKAIRIILTGTHDTSAVDNANSEILAALGEW